jgi:YidC/Oxa1 family membrane protein insertase
MTTIENRRFALMVAIGVIVFLLYQAWQKDFAPKVAPPTATAPEDPGDVPTAAADVPTAPTAAGEAPRPAVTPVPAAEQRITVSTDKLVAVISTHGGDLRRVELLGYPVTKHQPDHNVALLDDRDNHWFVIQSGLTSSAGPVVSHKERFAAAATSYALADGADVLEVPLEYADAQGRKLVKTWRFHRGSYVIDLSQRLANGGAAPVAANAYVQLWNVPFAAGEEPPFTATFSGVGFYEQKSGAGSFRFRKVAYKDLAEEALDKQQTGGWLAMLQHYFFAAVIPPQDEAGTWIAKPGNARDKGGYVGQYIGATREVAPGTEQEFTARVYVGPKLQRELAAITPGLELTIDYGWLTAVAQPLFWLLDWFHKLTGNWGAAIILLTFAVKLVMFKLSEAQYRGMAKMKKYAPRIQELKERYGDDRERMHKAMMELYKKEKFNPLAGCWPLLVQFPVFIALYWVLLESVELRQADFALWLNDLSSPDPYYVMPVLFGISMFVQQKLSGNVAMDPMQQRVMNIMPVMLTVFFAFFPVGLVLYWFVSNLIGIAQQWYITRKLEREGLSHR